MKHLSCVIPANDRAPFCNSQCERRLWSANHSLWGTDGLTNVNSSLALCASRCQITVRAGGKAHLGLWQAAVGTTEMERASELIKTVMTIRSTRHCWFSFILFNFLACTTLIAKFPMRDSRCLPLSTWGQQRNTGAKYTSLRSHYEVFINCISNELLFWWETHSKFPFFIQAVPSQHWNYASRVKSWRQTDLPGKIFMRRIHNVFVLERLSAEWSALVLPNVELHSGLSKALKLMRNVFPKVITPLLKVMDRSRAERCVSAINQHHWPQSLQMP